VGDILERLVPFLISFILLFATRNTNQKKDNL